LKGQFSRKYGTSAVEMGGLRKHKEKGEGRGYAGNSKAMQEIAKICIESAGWGSIWNRGQEG